MNLKLFDHQSSVCKQLWQKDFLHMVFCNTMQYPGDIFDKDSDHFHHSNLKY